MLLYIYSRLNKRTWRTNEDDFNDLIQVGGAAFPQDQLLVTVTVEVSVSVETNAVIGPIRVVDQILVRDDELLIDAGRITRGEGESGCFRIQTEFLISSII